LFQKSEADEFFEELEKFISTDEYGDSDTDGATRTFEGRTTRTYDVGFTNHQFTQVGEDEHREKSPGFGDFFRIDESDFQPTHRVRRSNFLPTDDNSFDDDNVTTETNTRHAIIINIK